MSTPRRSFLGRLGALLAVGAVPSTALAASVRSAEPPRDATRWPDERWLEAIANGEHRMLVETGTLADVIGFRRMVNYLDAMKNDYHIPDNRLGVALGVHSTAISLALNDTLWAKYKLGERGGLKTPSGAAPTTHPFRAGGPASVEGLSARGVWFLACNNSLRRLSREFAGTGDPAPIYTELVAGVLPQFQLVPAMIAAVGRAQERNVPVLVVG
ncbi:MAG: hypothetical protein ACKVS7_00845 [Gemmatimonadaceae bacterium]